MVVLGNRRQRRSAPRPLSLSLSIDDAGLLFARLREQKLFEVGINGKLHYFSELVLFLEDIH